MDLHSAWDKALRETDIIRSRVSPLATFENTVLPYVFLARSLVNEGDTVVRNGRVNIHKPSLILPGNIPQFKGFQFEKDLHFNEDTVTNFLLVRGVSFPSLKYDNKTSGLEVYEGRVQKAIEHYGNLFARKEDVHAGLVVGPADCWQLSILIFIASLMMKSADTDIKKILEDFRRRYGNPLN